MSLTLDPAALARRQAAETADYYQVGQAYGMLVKAADTPVAVPVLHGRLVATKSGWILLSVPNALVRGLFDAMNEPGAELPPDSEHGPFNAHISVMRASELESIGGPDRVSERGHMFKYQLGPVKVVEPAGWKEMSKVWFVEVSSPELRKLRVSYGLTPLPDGDKPFHITICVRRKKVLHDSDVTKAAADEDDSEDVHGGQHEDVHSDENSEPTVPKKEIRMPLVMRRITVTSLSFGKPDGDDADGIEEFMNHLRDRAGKAGDKQAALEKTAMNDDYAWGFKPIAERISSLERQPDYPRKAAQIAELRRKLAQLTGEGTYGPSPWTKTAAGMGDVARMFAQGFRGATPALAGVGRQALRGVVRPNLAGLGAMAGRVRPALAGFGRNALGGADPTLRNVGRFMAGVPEGQAFAPTFMKGLGNTVKAVAKPRYPLFDRPAGLPITPPGPNQSAIGGAVSQLGRLAGTKVRPRLTSSWFEMPPAGAASMPRVLDRTRSAIGRTASQFNRIALVGTLPVAGNAMFRAYPDLIADNATRAAQGAGLSPDQEHARNLMRWEAPGVYANLIRDAAGNLVDRATDNPVGRFAGQALSHVVPDKIVDQAPPTWAHSDPTSKFVRNVVGDIAWPTVRHDTYTARQTKPKIMGAIDAMRSTTPLGAAMTGGIWGASSAEPSNVAAAVKQHLPALTAAAISSPTTIDAGPYASFADALKSIGDPLNGKVRQVLASLGGHAGSLSPEQAQKLYDMTLPADVPDPTIGELGEKFRDQVPAIPENYQQHVDDIRRLLPGTLALGEKTGAISDPLNRRRRRRPATWTGDDLARSAATGGIVGGGGYMLGRGLEDVGKRLAFEPNPSWQLSEANQAVQNAPDITSAVNEYTTRFPLAMNQEIYGKKTPFQIMHDMRTEGTPIREQLPMVKSLFPDTFASDEHTRAHYTGFAKGPVSAYNTLLREYLKDNDAGDILGGLDAGRAKVLEQSLRTTLGRNPNASVAEFMNEYGNRVIQAHAPLPSPDMASRLGSVGGVLRLLGRLGPRTEAKGILGPEPTGKAQAGATLRRLALEIDRRLPPEEQAAEYFRQAKPLFEKGTDIGEDPGMAALAAKMSRPGQAAGVLGRPVNVPKSVADWGATPTQTPGLSPVMPKGDASDWGIQRPTLRSILSKNLEDAVTAETKRLGVNELSPSQQADVVKRVGTGPEADLAALKIDKHLTVGDASGMYDLLNKALALPGHAARFAQGTAPYLKAIAPAAGLGLAGYGLYRYLNPPARVRRRPRPRPVPMQSPPVMPMSMKAAAFEDAPGAGTVAAAPAPMPAPVPQSTLSSYLGSVAGTVNAAGKAIPQIRAFNPETSQHLSEVNRRVQSAPDITSAVNEYATGYPQELNRSVYGSNTPFTMLRDLRTEGSSLRENIPLAKSYFPDTFEDPHTRQHYEGFAAGPISAYKTLMRENLENNDAGDITTGLDTARPRILAQSVRNVLARNPRATSADFLNEYGDQIVKTHAPLPPPDPIKDEIGPAADVLRLVGRMAGPQAPNGLLGTQPTGKVQAGVSLRRLALALENRLPPGERATDYFEQARPLFQGGTIAGDDKALLTMASKMTRRGQAAEALGLSPDMPLPEDVAGPVRPPNLRNILSDKLEAAKQQQGRTLVPAEEAALVKRVTAENPELADLAALKIDKHLTVGDASRMYNTLNKILAAPGYAGQAAQDPGQLNQYVNQLGQQAGQLRQQIGPQLKSMAPAAGAAALRGLYNYWNQPAAPGANP